MLNQLISPNQADSLTSVEIKRILEAALLTMHEPLPLAELKKLFNNTFDAKIIHQLLEELREKWTESGIELVNVAGGWRFQTKTEMQQYLDRLGSSSPPRYSRAVLETLAIIVYRQPVTRGDIEKIRGVSVSGAILKTLMTRGWVDIIGHRNIPGKPALYATTPCFLNDLSLSSLEDLPPLEEPESHVESNEDKRPPPVIELTPPGK